MRYNCSKTVRVNT